MIRVLVASAPNPARQRLLDALRDDEIGLSRVVCGARSVTDIAGLSGFDAVLVSSDLAGLDRPSWRAVVSAADPRPVLVILNDPTESSLLDALWAGARGAVLRSRPERAPAAIRAAVDGEMAIPREATRLLVSTVIRPQQLIFGEGPMSRLTSRERQVLRLMQESRSTKQIAHELGVATVTVRTHVSAILRKLEVTDRASAAAAPSSHITPTR